MNDTKSAAPTATDPRDSKHPKVPPFARYKGTSVWRKDRIRARAYALYLAATKKADAPSA